MATGPEHYAEAERLIAQADEWLDGEDAPDSFELVHARRAEDLAAAQAHATLALAAATALGPHAYPTYSHSDNSGWLDAAGWGSPKAGA